MTAQSVGFFADSDLHGVLARQRELAELDHAIRAARAATDAAASARETRKRAQGAAAGISRRKHGLVVAAATLSRSELELLQLKQVAEASGAQAGANLRRASQRSPSRNAPSTMRWRRIDAEVAAQRTRSASRRPARAREPRERCRKSRWLRARALAGGRAGGAGSRICRALVPRAHRRARPAARGDRRAGCAAGSAARAAGDRAPADRLDAGRAIAAGAAGHARWRRAGTRRGAGPSRGYRRRAARRRRAAACRRSEARAGAEPDRGGETQGAGGRVVRSAICRATRRSARRARGLARAAQGLGPRQLLARRDRAPDAGARWSGCGQSRRARRGSPRRAAQELSRCAGAGSDRGDDDAESAIRQIDRESARCCSRPSMPSTSTSASSFRPSSAAARRGCC